MATYKHPLVDLPLIESKLEVEPGAGTVDVLTIMGFGDEFPDNPPDGYLWSLTSKEKNPIYVYDESNLTWLQVGCNVSTVKSNVMLAHNLVITVRNERNNAVIPGASVYVIGPHAMLRYGSLLTTSEHGQAEFALNPPKDLQGNLLSDGKTQFYARVGKKNYTSRSETFYTATRDITTLNVYLKWLFDTPSVLTLTWTDESDDHYAKSFGEYKFDKLEFEKYSFQYHVFQMEPEATNSSVDVALRSIINISDELPENYHYKFMHHRFALNGDYSFNDYLNWEDFGEGITAEKTLPFDIDKTYKQFDVVSFDGLYYRANGEIPSVSLSNSEVWEKVKTSEYVSGELYDEGQICYVKQEDESLKFYAALSSGRLAKPDSAVDIGDWAFVYPWPHENRDWQQNELALFNLECYRAKMVIQGTEPGSSPFWSEYDVIYNHERDYAKGDVAIFQKIWYEAKTNLLSRAPNRGRQWKKLTSTGTFSLGRIYKVNEIVEFRGAYYRARFENSNVWPYDYKFWIPLRVINSDPVHSQENLYQVGAFTTYFPAAETVTELIVAGISEVYDSAEGKRLNPNGTYVPEISSSILADNVWSMSVQDETYKLKSFTNSGGKKGWLISRDKDKTSYEFWTSPVLNELQNPWEQWQTNVGKLASDASLPTDNCVYQAKVDVARGTPFIPSQWKQCSITDLDLEFKPYKTYNANALCIASKNGQVQSYQALKETKNSYPPDSPEDWKETSPILPGELIICTLIYNPRNSYEVGDWVYYNGDFYEAVEASSNNTPFNNFEQWTLVNAFSRQLNYAKNSNVMVPSASEASSLGVPLGACYTSKLPTLGNVWDSNSQYYNEFYNTSVYGHFNNSFYRIEHNWLPEVYVHLDREDGEADSSRPVYGYRPIAMKIPASTLGNLNLWQQITFPEIVSTKAYHLEEVGWNDGKLYECMQEGALGSDFNDITKWQPISYHEFSENASYQQGDLVHTESGEIWKCIESAWLQNISPAENGYNDRANYTATDWGFYQVAWFWWNRDLPEVVEDYDANKVYYKGDFVRFPYNGQDRVYKLQNVHACPSQAPGKNGFWASIPSFNVSSDYAKDDAVYSNDWKLGGTYKAAETADSIVVGWGNYESWFESESKWKIWITENYDPVTEFKAGEAAWDRKLNTSSANKGFYYVAKTDIDNRFINSEVYWEKANEPKTYSEKSNFSAGDSVTNSSEATWYRVPTQDIVSLHPQINTTVWQNYHNLNSTNYYVASDYAAGYLCEWNGMLMEAKEAISYWVPQYSTTENWRRLYSYDETASYAAQTEDGLPTAVYRGQNESECVYIPKGDLPSNHRVTSNVEKGVAEADAFWKTEAIKTYKSYLAFSAGETVFKKYSNSQNYSIYEALEDIPVLKPMHYMPSETPPSKWRYVNVFHCFNSYNVNEIVAPWFDDSANISDSQKRVYRARQNIPAVGPNNADFWTEIFDFDSTKSYQVDEFVMIDRGYNDFDIYRALQPSTGIHPDSGANQHGTYWEKRSQTKWSYHDDRSFPIYSVIKIDGYDYPSDFFSRFPFDFETWYTRRSRFWYAIQQVPSANPTTANVEYWEAIPVSEWSNRNDYALGAYVHHRYDQTSHGTDDCLYEDFGYGLSFSGYTYYPRFFVAAEEIVSTNVIYNDQDNAGGAHKNFWRKIKSVGYYSHASDYAAGAYVDDTANAIGLSNRYSENFYYFEVALKNVISNDISYNDRHYSGSHEIFWESRDYVPWSDTRDWTRGEFTRWNYAAQARKDLISRHISYADGYYEGSHQTFWRRLVPYRGYNYLNDYEAGTYVRLDWSIYRAQQQVISNHWEYYVDEDGNPNPKYPNHPTFWEQRQIANYDCGKDYETGDMVLFNSGNFGCGINNEYSSYYYYSGSFRELHPEVETWCRNSNGQMFRCKKSFKSNVVGRNEFWIRQTVLVYDSEDNRARFDYSTEDVVSGYIRYDNTNNYYEALLKPKAPIESTHLLYSDKPFTPNEGGYDQYESWVIAKNLYDPAAELVFDVVLGKSQNNEDDTKTTRFYIQVDRAVSLNFWSYNGNLNINVGILEGNWPGQIYGLEGFNPDKPWIDVEVDGVKTRHSAPADWYNWGYSGFDYTWTAYSEELNGYNYPKSVTLISGPSRATVVRQSHPLYDGDFRYLTANHRIYWNLIEPVPDHVYTNDYAVGDIVRYNSASWTCVKPIISNALQLWNDPARARWERHKVYAYDFTGKNFDYDEVRNDWLIPANEPLISSQGGYYGWGSTKKKVISYSLDKTKYWFCYFVQGAFSMYKESFETIAKSFPAEEPLTVGLFIDTSGSIESPARVFRNADLSTPMVYPRPPKGAGLNELYSWFKEFAIVSLKLTNGISTEYQKGSYIYEIEDNILRTDKGLKFGGVTDDYDVLIDAEDVLPSEIVEGKEAGSFEGHPADGAIAGGESINSIPMPTEPVYLILEAGPSPSAGGSVIYVQYKADTLNDPEARKAVQLNGQDFPDGGFSSNERRAWTVEQQPFLKTIIDNLREKFKDSPSRVFYFRYRWVTKKQDENYKFPWLFYWKIDTNNTAIMPGYEWQNSVEYPVLFYPVWQPYCDMEGVEYGGCTLQFLQKASSVNPNPSHPYQWAITFGGGNDSNYDDVAYGEGAAEYKRSLSIYMRADKSYDYSAYPGVVVNNNSTDFAFCKNYKDFVFWAEIGLPLLNYPVQPHYVDAFRYRYWGNFVPEEDSVWTNAEIHVFTNEGHISSGEIIPGNFFCIKGAYGHTPTGGDPNLEMTQRATFRANPNPGDPATWVMLTTDGTLNGTTGTLSLKGETYNLRLSLSKSNDLEVYIKWLFDTYPNVQLVVPKTSQDERWLNWTRSFIEDFRVFNDD